MNTEPENPWLKARRLSAELSETLALCSVDDVGKWAAHIMPKGDAFLTAFVSVDHEHPSQRVDRLASELSEALNDYAGGRFHARIYPEQHGGHSFYFAATKAHEREGV